MRAPNPPQPRPRRRDATSLRKGGVAAQGTATTAEVQLRLAIGPAGLGLELAEAARIGCARVTVLTTALPNVRFPVDVSGGVARFRHRQGELRLVEIEIAAPALERWAAPRLRGLVGSRTPEVWVRVRPGAATVCVAEATEPDRSENSLPR